MNKSRLERRFVVRVAVLGVVLRALLHELRLEVVGVRVAGALVDVVRRRDVVQLVDRHRLRKIINRLRLKSRKNYWSNLGPVRRLALVPLHLVVDGVRAHLQRVLGATPHLGRVRRRVEAARLVDQRQALRLEDRVFLQFPSNVGFEYCLIKE